MTLQSLWSGFGLGRKDRGEWEKESNVEKESSQSNKPTDSLQVKAPPTLEYEFFR